VCRRSESLREKKLQNHFKKYEKKTFVFNFVPVA